MAEPSREGIDHFNEGRFSEALLCFRASLNAGQRDPQTGVFLGHAACALGRWAEAVAAFTAVIAERPRHLPAYEGLAHTVLRRLPARDPEAERTLQGIKALKPAGEFSGSRLAGAQRTCAHALRAAGDLGAAEIILRRALTLSPRDRLARQNLGELLRLKADASPDDLDATEKSLRAALAFDPGHSATRARLTGVLRRRALALVAAGKPSAAEKILRGALALSPRDRETRASLTAMMGERARSLQSAGKRRLAETLSRRISALDPRDARAPLSQGTALYVAGKVRESRAPLARAVRLDRGTLAPRDRFKALIKLGRYQEAVAAAEKILDGRPVLADLRAFWDPWDWDERVPRAALRAEFKKLERDLGPSTAAPWVDYYRTDLLGPPPLGPEAPRADFPEGRYGWMYFKPALAALLSSRFEAASAWFRLALKHEPADWRARAFLAEASLCLKRPEEAFAEMDRARLEAPSNEAGQVLAWRGAMDLWLGRYEEALGRLEEACDLEAQCAFGWKGASLLLLGRPQEALAQLDLTLARYPLDFESWLWRGETKRVLGRYQEALKDLSRVPPAVGTWALFNRALVKAALGDDAGMKADFDALPDFIVTYLRKKTGLTDPRELLQAGLRLSRGFRREEYRQAFWLDA